jgi:hypothetical protein
MPQASLNDRHQGIIDVLLINRRISFTLFAEPGDFTAMFGQRPTARSGRGKFSRRGVMKYSARAEGFRIAYDRMGSGKPVVLLHGWPGDRTDYSALAPILAQHTDVIVPDLRGFGQSDKHLVETADRVFGTGTGKGRHCARG